MKKINIICTIPKITLMKNKSQLTCIIKNKLYNNIYYNKII